MRILPVANYQTQNKQNQNFGFLAIKNGDRELVDIFCKEVLNRKNLHIMGSNILTGRERSYIGFFSNSNIHFLIKGLKALKKIEIDSSQAKYAIEAIRNAQVAGLNGAKLTDFRIGIWENLGLVKPGQLSLKSK